ncbi:CorA family divalent cation transporter [Thermodesulfitimonas sp.]
MEAPIPDEVALLTDLFNFHPLAVENCLYGQQRAKLDTSPDYLFLILYAAVPTSGEKGYRRIQFDLSLGRQVLVTFHQEPAKARTADKLRRGREGEWGSSKIRSSRSRTMVV